MTGLVSTKFGGSNGAYETSRFLSRTTASQLAFKSKSLVLAEGISRRTNSTAVNVMQFYVYTSYSSDYWHSSLHLLTVHTPRFNITILQSFLNKSSA